MDAAYGCFLFLGCGALLPWNALLTGEGRCHTTRTLFFLPSWQAARPTSLPCLPIRPCSRRLLGGPVPGELACAARLRQRRGRTLSCPFLLTGCTRCRRLQGRHTDRLLTVAYLPANLAVVAAMVALHGALRPRLRGVVGLLGFSLALLAVTWVSRVL